MSNPAIEVTGTKELSRALEKLGDEIKREASNEVEYTGQELRTEIIRKYQDGPATGGMYFLKNPNRTHRASAVGEYPMSDTGRLATGTIFKRIAALSVQVSNNIKYAAPLEFGSRGQGPRPAWRDTVDETQPKFLKRLAAIISKEVKQ
jgi:hypothetical protein|tara:strand:+ start:1582 stop:2025 length:444 start_codon:yes stop_codon:yes gene_type:complete